MSGASRSPLAALRRDPGDRGAVPGVALGGAAALRLAQERYGWLSARGVPRGRRRARPDARVLPGGRVLLRHVPPRARRPAPRRGLHERLVRARRRAAGAGGVRGGARRPRRARRPRTARSRCARSSARAAAAGAPSSPSTTATASRCAPRTSPRSSRSCVAGGEPHRPRRRGRARPHEARGLPRGRRLRGAGEGARAGAAGGRRRAARPRTCAAAAAPASRWAGRRASSRRAPASRPTSSSTRTSPSRARSRTARSCSRVPHRLIEGCLITAHAIGSTERLHLHPRRVPRRVRDPARALDEVREAELLGGVTIVLHRGAGAYICGEETALLESLEGKRGQPRSKPPFPAVPGLYASPTLINNVETVATVPAIIELGRREYAKLGVRTPPARASSRSRATSSTAGTTSCRSGRRCAS